MTDVCLNIGLLEQKVSVWRGPYWRHRFLSNGTQLNTNTACCFGAFFLQSQTCVWGLDCFPNGCTEEDAEVLRRESIFLSAESAKSTWKKKVFPTLRMKAELFFYSRYHGVRWVFVWLPLKCIRSVVDRIVCNGKLRYLLSGDCVALFLRNKQLLPQLKEFAATWSSQVTLLVFLQIYQMLFRCWWWHAWWFFFFFFLWVQNKIAITTKKAATE